MSNMKGLAPLTSIDINTGEEVSYFLVLDDGCIVGKGIDDIPEPLPKKEPEPKFSFTFQCSKEEFEQFSKIAGK